ncbi:GntR family transcriptional regulator [Albidovulum sediminicola]|uniref:GntR family transcriptional regulator n=1 Tax=Albidovulum sediminicola TaxID=2984331 RepID=A0ABT2Z6S7_9RHOB|nr:GntR family transcriptional regulator [Defluviimonas sp. WL0075]MCV2866722.1 GntR family transcriptional regulator [Defluviimonas sp. WL0075]
MDVTPEAELIDPPEPKVDATAIQRLLLERICLLKYQPGDQLKEAELAREFGVSRTPVRDALNRISHLGLIVSRNGVGTVVVSLTAEQIRHVYEMRLELACLIGRLSPITPGPAHLAALQRLLDRALTMHSRFSADDYLAINHELNELIASMIGNTSLRSMWLQAYVQAASTWHRVADTMGPEVSEALVKELTDLIIAVERGDAEAIGYIQRVHIGYGFGKVKEVYSL